MKPRFKNKKSAQNSEQEKEQNVNHSQQFRLWTLNQEGPITRRKYQNKFNKKGKKILDRSLRFIRNLNTRRQSLAKETLNKSSHNVNDVPNSNNPFAIEETQGNPQKMIKENSAKFLDISLNQRKTKICKPSNKKRKRLRLRNQQRKSNLMKNKLIAEQILRKKNMSLKIDSDDDDCICIDPPIELINLDDEGRKFKVESNRRFNSPKPNNKYLTSTPNVKRKPNSPHLLCETIILDDTLSTSINEPSTALNASTSYQPNPFSKSLNKKHFNQYNRGTPPPKRLLSSQEEKMYFIHSFESNPNNLKVPIYVASTKILTETSSNSVTELTTAPLIETATSTLTKGRLNHNEIIDISDDSVSIINTPEYIPLSSLNVRRKRKETKHDKLNKRNEPESTQNPKKPQNKKRMVIIDGNNVAYSHARSKEFSVKGLELCIQYFVGLGHEVKAVLPQMRLKRNKSSDPDLLNRLHSENLIVFTPCKNLPGKTTSSYDDRIILELADQLDGVIISNDNFKDLVNENKSFKRLIETRVIGFTWCDDTFVLPKDPYGRWGPPLSAILERRS